ncbi:amidohydrolase [Leeia sp.]|uniref:amidohydrolase n=1 Tax=Leeia sp. TaxID=2884678 RepID=UPI0035B27353
MRLASFVAAALLPLACFAGSDKAILYGGTIYTAAAQGQPVTAVGISQGRIVAMGSYQQVSQTMGAEARRVHLGGHFLMPGMVDTHVHTGFAGFQQLVESLPPGLKSTAALQGFWNKVKTSPRLRQDKVVVFSDVSLDYWDNLTLLDQFFNAPAFKDQPVLLAGMDAHTGWVNQAMLRYAGLDDAALQSLDATTAGQFARRPDGTPNGFTSEGAWDRLLGALPPVSDDKMKQAIQLGAQTLNQFGVTAWLDPISNIRPRAPIFSRAPTREDTGLIPVYAQLAREGRLTGRVSGLALVGIHSEPGIIADVLALQARYSGGNFRLAGIKILQDGVIESPSHTAKLSKPYQGEGSYSGSTDLDQPRFNALIAEADKQRLLAHFHVIGDRAVTEALEAIAAARQQNGGQATAPVVHSLAHLEVVNDAQMAYMGKLGVAASMQLLWAGKDPTTTSLLKEVDPALKARLYPAGSMLRHGVLLAGGSDWPVTSPNPFEAIYTAVTRRGPLGVLEPASERISRDDALKAYTINAATLMGMQQDIGSIALGKRADFVLLDRNPLTVSPEQLRRTTMLWTMLDGQQIYQRGQIRRTQP